MPEGTGSTPDRGHVYLTHLASWGTTLHDKDRSAFHCEGVITDYNESFAIISAPEQNEVGAVIGTAHYDTMKEMTCTIQCDSSEAAGLLKPGEPINVSLFGEGAGAGAQWWVTRAEVVENNLSFCRVNVSATNYANCDEVFVAGKPTYGND